MNKVYYVDSIRGAACIVVVLSHISLTFFPQLHNFSPSKIQSFKIFDFIFNSPFSFFYSGTAAVFCFFILSGYILTYVSIKKEYSLQLLLNTIIKRYFRLAIPSVVSCLLFWLILYFYNININNVSEWFRELIPNNHSLADAFYSGAVSPFIRGTSLYNPALWTMKIEFRGSLLIFLLCFLYNKKFLRNSIIIIILIYCLSSYSITKMGLLSFLIGYFIYFYSKNISLYIAISLLFFGLYLCGVHQSSNSYYIFYKIADYISNQLPERIYNYLNFIGAFFVILSIIKSKLCSFLNKNYLLLLGKLSFSIYLLHICLMYLLVIPIFNHILLITESYFVSSLASVFLTLFITFSLAIPFSKYIDQMGITFAKNITSIKIRLHSNRSDVGMD